MIVCSFGLLLKGKPGSSSHHPAVRTQADVTYARYFAGLTALVPPDRAAHVLSYKVIHFKLIVKRLLGKGTKKMAKKENMYFT